MKNLIAAMFVVKWTLIFTPDDGHKQKYPMIQVFTDEIRAAEFLVHRPKWPHECVTETTGQHGTCYVRDFQLSVDHRTEEEIRNGFRTNGR